MRTPDDITTSIYRYVVEHLGDTISGNVYNNMDRPLNSDREDIVIRIIANATSQRQEATINVNIYVPDILKGSEYVYDGERLPQMEREAINVLERFFAGEALVVMESQLTMPSATGKEHVINNRLNYQVINE